MISPSPFMFPWQRMVKNLEKELVLLKQELAIHDSLVRGCKQRMLEGLGPGADNIWVKLRGGGTIWVEGKRQQGEL